VPFYSTGRGPGRRASRCPRWALRASPCSPAPTPARPASRSINSLRGVGVTVNLVGGTTCGKPYGFYPQDNCGTTYFAIQFKGVNQAGYGDYGDGFAPTCTVADDFDHQLGDTTEARLAAALGLRSGGACPAASSKAAAASVGLDKAGPAAADAEPEQPYLRDRTPLRQNRLLEAAPNPA
jgi:carboxyl-terminal processing protease